MEQYVVWSGVRTSFFTILVSYGGLNIWCLWVSSSLSLFSAEFSFLYLLTSVNNWAFRSPHYIFPYLLEEKLVNWLLEMPDPDLWPEIKRKTRDLARTDTDLKIGYRVQIKYSLTLTFQSSQNKRRFYYRWMLKTVFCLKDFGQTKSSSATSTNNQSVSCMWR